MTAVKCPYGEQRGFAVYCRAAGRLVNPMVMPCRSPNYPKCKFYVEAERRRAEQPPQQASTAGGSQAPSAGAGGPGPQASPQAAGAQRAGGAGELLSRWSEEESRSLADPLFLARVLVAAQVVAAGRLPAGSLEEFLRGLHSLAGGPGSGCLLAVVSLRGGDVYLKVCGGSLVASASRSGPLSPGELESAVKEAGGSVSVVLYRVGEWG